jgi:hypothetical protein
VSRSTLRSRRRPPELPPVVENLFIFNALKIRRASFGVSGKMSRNLRFASAFGLLAFAISAAMTDSASAVSVEVAKKCNALTAKAFPPREVGNPAAGSAKGTGADQRAYFKNCVAKEGKIPNQ